MPSGPRASLLLLILVAAPLAPPPAAAQTSDAFALLSVARAGDVVTVELKAIRYVFDPTFSLTADGALAALPERTTGQWKTGDVGKLNFTLIDPALARATLSMRWIDSSGSSITHTISFPVPARSSSPPPAGAPRLLVASATLAGRTLDVEISNGGTAGSKSVLVSVEDEGGRKIGSPFYRDLAPIAAGRSATARFDVPDSLASVVVAVEHDGATARTAVVVRRTSATTGGGTPTPATNVSLATELPFREVDVGRTVDYALTVRNSGRLALVQLEAIGLPSGYSARFFVGGSAVPSLYLDRNQTRQVTLSITVPNAAAEVDRTVDFSVRAMVNGTEAARLNAGLAVRGVGKLEIASGELFANVPPGGTGTFTVTVRNTGSAPLFDVQLDSRRPYGWTLRFDPRTLDRLDPGQSASVSVEVRAPDVVGPGRYTTDLTAKTGDVTSRATTLAMEVEEPGGGASWLWIVFLAAIGGVLALAAKFRRKGG